MRYAFILLGLVIAGCGETKATELTGSPDAAAQDGGAEDSQVSDRGAPDDGDLDAAADDAGSVDSASPDTGAADGGRDSGLADAGVDGGTTECGNNPGDRPCNALTEVCVVREAGPGFFPSCVAVPQGCENDRSCACLRDLCMGAPFLCQDTTAPNRIECVCPVCQ